MATTERSRGAALADFEWDGRLHLSWDHHNNPLRYTKTRAGFLARPPQRMTPEDFERKQRLFDDGDRDVLTGSSGLDWFFVSLLQDEATDQQDNEAEN